MNFVKPISTSGARALSSSSINVVFGTDRPFLPYTAVAIRSLLASYRDNRHLRIYLLVDQPLSADDRVRYNSLRFLHPFELTEICVDASRFQNVRTTQGITVATYYRLYMHKLLPADADRAIWLDGDIIVEDCISKLFDADIGDAMFGGVEDSYSSQYRRRFGVPETAPNINCGILIANLRAMQSTNFLEQVSEYIEHHGHKIMLGDQQILNTLFYDRIAYIPVRWNVHGRLLDPKWMKKNPGLNNLAPSEIARASKKPGIIHYCGNSKPWDSTARQHAAEMWRKHALASPYKDIFETLPPLTTPGRPRGAIRAAWHRLRSHRWHMRQLRKFSRSTSLGAVRADHELMNRMLRSQMQIILSARGQQITETRFSARGFVEGLSPGSQVALCGTNEDLTGGFHENLKTIFRTPHIGIHIAPHNADFCLFLIQGLRSLRHWDCLNAAQMGTPMIFGETNFFGAFAGYYDREASVVERKCFGYILDDMGYYFDANQSSRLETTLNNPTFLLAPDERRRAAALIDRVVSERLTKYNKYVGAGDLQIEPDSVIVVDQRQYDASITFGGANRQTFRTMIDAAIAENPDRTVYIKRHPDNVHTKDKSLHHHKAIVLPDDADITSALDECHSVYTVSSQVGFEALLRRKHVVTFGLPFYAGWGLTDDRGRIPRRKTKRQIEDLFHAACIQLSVYINPDTGALIEIEEAFNHIAKMREAARS